MRIASAAASRGPLSPALDQVLARTVGELQGATADLGAVFVTNHFEDELGQAARRIVESAKVNVLIGCTAGGVIGPEHEHEREPAIALWLAHLPGTELRPFHLAEADLASADSLREKLDITAEARPSFLMFGDPFSVDVNGLLAGMQESYPGRPVVGGMASGAEAPGQSALVLNGSVQREGVVGVALSGAIHVETVVSQGCRPVGKPFIITKAERNVIHQLSGRPALEVLNQAYAEAPTSDQKLMRQGVFIGRVINEQQPEFHRGDFLIRNLMGADQESGAIAVGDLMRVGSTVQFHVRDADSAGEDLNALLTPFVSPPPRGALLFSCNGRGTRMFPQRDHDLGVLKDKLGTIPIAGFFCAGELGPVGGRNFIHGHTASIALFRDSQ